MFPKPQHPPLPNSHRERHARNTPGIYHQHGSLLSPLSSESCCETPSAKPTPPHPLRRNSPVCSSSRRSPTSPPPAPAPPGCCSPRPSTCSPSSRRRRCSSSDSCCRLCCCCRRWCRPSCTAGRRRPRPRRRGGRCCCCASGPTARCGCWRLWVWSSRATYCAWCGRRRRRRGSSR